MFGHTGFFLGCEQLVQLTQLPCLSLEHTRIALSGAVRGTDLVEMFTSAVWWVNESYHTDRCSCQWYDTELVDMLRFGKLRVELCTDKP